MSDVIEFGDIAILVTRKDVKNVHLSVHPPDGAVSLVAPLGTRIDVIRAFASAKVGWIRRQQLTFREQGRETRREYVTRESHHVWGKRYLLVVAERDERPSVRMSHRQVALTVRPGSDRAQRAAVLHRWQRELLHTEVRRLISHWEPRLGVKVKSYFLQRMKTKWGGCNHRSGTIRLNTELVKYSKHLVEYVVVHEMVHLLEPTHGPDFLALLERHIPTWREARAELNSELRGEVKWKKRDLSGESP